MRFTFSGFYHLSNSFNGVNVKDLCKQFVQTILTIEKDKNNEHNKKISKKKLWANYSILSLDESNYALALLIIHFEKSLKFCSSKQKMG